LCFDHLLGASGVIKVDGCLGVSDPETLFTHATHLNFVFITNCIWLEVVFKVKITVTAVARDRAIAT
jgi:hypothetical protein